MLLTTFDTKGDTYIKDMTLESVMDPTEGKLLALTFHGQARILKLRERIQLTVQVRGMLSKVLNGIIPQIILTPNTMKISNYLTVAGNGLVNDDSDDGPLIKLNFCNEAARLTDEQKLWIVQTTQEAFIKTLATTPVNLNPGLTVTSAANCPNNVNGCFCEGVGCAVARGEKYDQPLH